MSIHKQNFFSKCVYLLTINPMSITFFLIFKHKTRGNWAPKWKALAITFELTWESFTMSLLRFQARIRPLPTCPGWALLSLRATLVRVAFCVKGTTSYWREYYTVFSLCGFVLIGLDVSTEAVAFIYFFSLRLTRTGNLWLTELMI